MRKALYFFAAAALGLGLLCVSATRAQAQDVDENGIPRVMLQNLPNDPAVRVGHLDNGLTYYIRQNGLPEKRAEFYLATNVGGIQEDFGHCVRERELKLLKLNYALITFTCS